MYISEIDSSVYILVKGRYSVYKTQLSISAQVDLICTQSGENCTCLLHNVYYASEVWKANTDCVRAKCVRAGGGVDAIIT